jgi:hypothetical protein
MRLRAPVFVGIMAVGVAACERSAPRINDSAGVASPPAADSSRSDTTRSSWTVDAAGIGVVRAGMSLQELSVAVAEVVRPTYTDNPTCTFVRPKALPSGVLLMVLNDTVARVDVTEPGTLTTGGVGVGDLERRVIEVYGARAHVEPHKYTGPTGHYVIVDVPGDTLHRLVFETDGRNVGRYRAGRRPGVDYVEGCS